MSDVFHRLHRVRKLEEQRARVELVRLEEARDARLAEVLALEAQLQESHTLAANDVAMMQHHHAYALRGEVQRRGNERALQQAERAARTARTKTVEAAMEARSVELLAEAMELREALAARSAERKALDEVGSQQWMRRAS